MKNFQRRVFELCLAVYRTTSFFPAGEILSSKLKEAALQIIVLLAKGQIRDTIFKAEEIEIYLGIAKEQNWIKPINFDLLKSAYLLLTDVLRQIQFKEEIIAEKQKTAVSLLIQKKEPQEKAVFGEISQRHGLIIDYFNKNKEAKVSGLVNFLGNVSGRTIRNDLNFLIGKNFIKKIGSKKDARYLLNE